MENVIFLCRYVFVKTLNGTPELNDSFFHPPNELEPSTIAADFAKNEDFC